MRTPRALIGAGLAMLVASLAACGGSGGGSSMTQAEQRQIDTLAIDQIERKWHDAETHRNLAEMMSLWAPDASWQADTNLTLIGKPQIRKFWVTQVFPV